MDNSQILASDLDSLVLSKMNNNAACSWELEESPESSHYQYHYHYHHLLPPQTQSVYTNNKTATTDSPNNSSNDQIYMHSSHSQSHPNGSGSGSGGDRKRRCAKAAAGSGCKKLKTQRHHPPAHHGGYIHVRARRGQATDSHSLAERVRRQKISQRMKVLQTLVPGCHKVTGKALMLDEIINYVQSLQNQVEFLSMKLASVNPTLYDFGMDYPEVFLGTPASEILLNGNGMVSHSDQQAELAYNMAPYNTFQATGGGGGSPISTPGDINFINPSPLFLDHGNTSLLHLSRFPNLHTKQKEIDHN